MNHRIISLLMAMLMTVSLLPTAVWAAEEVPDQTAVPVIDDGTEKDDTAGTPEVPEQPEVPTVPQTSTDETQGEDEGIRVETSNKCGDNVYWSLDGNGTLTIWGTGAMWDYDSTSDGPTNPWWYIDWYISRISRIVVESGVTYIGDYAFCCNRAVNISIASSVKEIGSYSFSGCRGATSITLPDGLQRIDDCAFRGFGDETLETINIPSSVTYIGEAAFWQSGALTAINFDGTMDQWIDCGGGTSRFPRSVTLTCKGGSMARSGVCDDGLAWNLDNSGTLTISGNGEMADYYYDDNGTPTAPWANLRSMVRSIKIDSGVTSIGAWAFEETNIDTLSIPGSVKVIGHGAFYRNIYLSSVLLTNGTEVIDHEAFSDCIRLSSVSIPDTVTEIGRWAFYSCYNEYSQNGMHETGLASITIPGSVTSIGTDAFANCNLLKTVSFGGTQTQWNAIGGKDAGVPDTATINYVTVVGSGSCGAGVTWSLASNGVLTISGSGAMPDCTEDPPWWNLPVSQVVVCQGVTSIGALAFTSMKGITNVTIADSVTAIGTLAFAGCQMEELYLPRNLKTVGVEAFTDCAELKYLDMDKNCAVTLGDMSFKLCTALEAVHLSANIKLGEGVFAGCSNLKEVLFEGSGKQWLNLRSGLNFHVVTLECRGGGFGSGKCGDNLTWELDGSGLLTISGTGRMYDYQDTEDDTPEGPNSPWTFTADGTFLTPYIHEIKINYGVTHIGDTAFKYCHYVDDITIPGSVTSIGESAFRRCDILRNVTIPNTVTSIGANAFLNDNRLSAIYFSGTEEQWAALSQGIGLSSNVTIEYVKLGIITSGGTKPQAGDMQKLYENLTGQKGSTFTAVQEKAADVNQDGEIDVYDLQYLYELVSGIQTA